MMMQKTAKTAILIFSGFMVLAPLAATAKQPDGTKGKTKNWYMQTIVVAELDDYIVIDDRSGVFGRIPGGSEGKDIHDLTVFENVNGSQAAVVFTHGEEWGEHAGQYLSDYRPSGADRQVWDFVVTSSLEGAKVSLIWDGLMEITPSNGDYLTELNNGSPVLKSLSLVDLYTGEVIKAVGKKGVLNSYSFVMDNSGERHFRWVQGTVKPADLDSQGVAAMSVFAAPRARAAAASPLNATGAIAAPPVRGPTGLANPDRPAGSRAMEKEQ